MLPPSLPGKRTGGTVAADGLEGTRVAKSDRRSRKIIRGMGTGVEGRQEDNEGEGWRKLYLISITSLQLRRPPASPAVEFQCRLATAEFMGEALRSICIR